MKTFDDREIVIDMLILVTQINKFKSTQISAELNDYEGLSKSSKNFVIKMVYNIVKNVILIDYIIEQFCEKELLKESPFIHNYFRSFVYEVIINNNIDNNEILNYYDKIAKNRSKKDATKFINTLVKTIQSDFNEITFPEKSDSINYLSVMYSYPVWLVKYWVNIYGSETVEKIFAESSKEPVTSAYMNTLLLGDKLIRKSMKEDNVVFERDDDIKNLSFIKNVSEFYKFDSYKNGLLFLLNKSKAIAVDSLDLKENSDILNMVSRDGSLSFYCALKTNGKSNIVSLDSNPVNINSIKQNKERLKIDNVFEQLKDGAVYYEEFAKKFDYVILEAPSTNLGLIRKLPNQKFIHSFNDISKFTITQRKMLGNASKYLKDDGQILYLTSTISSKENVENVNWFVDNFDFEIKEIHQVLPGVDYDNCDGVFISIIQKKVGENNGKSGN